MQVKPHSLPWFTPSCADAIAHRNHFYTSSIGINLRRIRSSLGQLAKSSIAPLFNGPEVLTSSKDKANLFAGKFSANSTLDDTLHSLPDFSTRIEQEIFYMRISVIMVENTICEVDVAKATGPDCIPSIILKMCSPELFPVLAKLYNKCLFQSCFPLIGKFPLLYLLTKTMEKDLILVTIVPSTFFLSQVKYLNHL